MEFAGDGHRLTRVTRAERAGHGRDRRFLMEAEHRRTCRQERSRFAGLLAGIARIGSGETASRQYDFLAALAPPPDLLLMQEANRNSVKTVLALAGLK